MSYNCRITETIIGLVILLLALFPNLLGAEISKWAIVVISAILIIHSWLCKNCSRCKSCGVPVSKPAMSTMAKPMASSSMGSVPSSVPISSKPAMSTMAKPMATSLATSPMSKPASSPVKPMSAKPMARKPVRKQAKRSTRKPARRRR